MVSQISQLLSGTGTLQETLQQLQIGEEELLEQQANLASSTLKATTDTLSLSTEAKNLSGGSNMMSRNFAGGRENDSKYVNANLAGLQAVKQMQNQATSRVSGLLNSLGGIQGPRLYDGVGSKGGVPEATIQLAMKRIKDADSQDASERNLEETKECVEARAAEAMAPKDENGNPIETGTMGTGEAAPMPEISGSKPVPAANIAPTPDSAASVAAAPAPEVAAAPAPDVSAPVAPTTQSIDITV